MSTVAGPKVGVVVISGPREGEVLWLPSDVVSRAPGAEGPQPIDTLNVALDRLNSGLDRLIDAVKQSADDYALAADRLERKA